MARNTGNAPAGKLVRSRNPEQINCTARCLSFYATADLDARNFFDQASAPTISSQSVWAARWAGLS